MTIAVVANPKAARANLAEFDVQQAVGEATHGNYEAAEEYIKAASAVAEKTCEFQLIDGNRKAIEDFKKAYPKVEDPDPMFSIYRDFLGKYLGRNPCVPKVWPFDQ